MTSQVLQSFGFIRCSLLHAFSPCIRVIWIRPCTSPSSQHPRPSQESGAGPLATSTLIPHVVSLGTRARCIAERRLKHFDPYAPAGPLKPPTAFAGTCVILMVFVRTREARWTRPGDAVLDRYVGGGGGTRRRLALRCTIASPAARMDVRRMACHMSDKLTATALAPPRLASTTLAVAAQQRRVALRPR